MKKCKDCGLFECLRRGDGETECFYDIDLQRDKEAEEKSYWESFRAEAAKDILCVMLVDQRISETTPYKDVVKMSLECTDELIKQLKEKEMKFTQQEIRKAEHTAWQWLQLSKEKEEK